VRLSNLVKRCFVHSCFAVMVILAVGGCATDKYYSPVVQHSPPQRWPDLVPVCTRVAAVISQLHIAVNGVYIPESPNRPCPVLDSGPRFRDNDDAYIGEGNVDPSGFGGYAMSTYRVTIDNPEARARAKGLAGEDVSPVLNKAAGVNPNGYGVRFWRHHEEIYSRDEHINGLLWRHYAFTRYDSSSEDPTVMGQFETLQSVDIAEKVNNAPSVFDITEVYVHELDKGHAIIAKGRYERMVIEDKGWYASRSDLLNRMVKSIEIRDVSEAEVNSARAAFERAREARKAAERAR
jgi:hypothetical protein